MNPYELSNIRLVAAIAAVAMTAVTIAVSVIVPVGLSAIGHEATILAAPPSGLSPAMVATTVRRIEVIGIRDSPVASSPVPDATPTLKPRG